MARERIYFFAGDAPSGVGGALGRASTCACSWRRTSGLTRLLAKILLLPPIGLSMAQTSVGLQSVGGRANREGASFPSTRKRSSPSWRRYALTVVLYQARPSGGAIPAALMALATASSERAPLLMASAMTPSIRAD